MSMELLIINFTNIAYILQRILEGKRDKLRDQLEEAKRLKENTDRRAIQVGFTSNVKSY